MPAKPGVSNVRVTVPGSVSGKGGAARATLASDSLAVRFLQRTPHSRTCVRIWRALRRLRRDVAAYLVHVERPDLADQGFEGLLGKGAGLLEDDHTVTYRHDRRDRPDLELGGEIDLGLGVHLAEDDVAVAVGCPLVDRRERPARPAPGRPEVHQHDAFGARDLVEVRRGQRL